MDGLTRHPDAFDLMVALGALIVAGLYWVAILRLYRWVRKRRVRPRHGTWHHAATGDTSAVKFVAVGSKTYEAVLPDGSPIKPRPGDTLTIDVVGAGQSVQWEIDPTWEERDG